MRIENEIDAERIVKVVHATFGDSMMDMNHSTNILNKVNLLALKTSIEITQEKIIKRHCS